MYWWCSIFAGLVRLYTRYAFKVVFAWHVMSVVSASWHYSTAPNGGQNMAPAPAQMSKTNFPSEHTHHSSHYVFQLTCFCHYDLRLCMDMLVPAPVCKNFMLCWAIKLPFVIVALCSPSQWWPVPEKCVGYAGGVLLEYITTI